MVIYGNPVLPVFCLFMHTSKMSVYGIFTSLGVNKAKLSKITDFGDAVRKSKNIVNLNRIIL